MNSKIRGLLRITLHLVLFFPAVFLLTQNIWAADQDLIDRVNRLCGPLPQAMPSEQNPLTPAKVKLGRMLFYEPRISIDGTVSCAKCHPLSLYAADGLK